jgi:hypothetical protein
MGGNVQDVRLRYGIRRSNKMRPVKSYDKKLASSKSWEEFLTNVTDGELVEMMMNCDENRRKRSGC